MTTASENETLTRVGPGTPMGELMRQYWVPCALSSELKADGDPLRVLILGEKLVAFRDSQGKVGILDHRCPHRRASLFYGRNEGGGIRCVYHGWKFDVTGRCLETQNVPNPEFATKVRARAYHAAERNGVVYVYMGQREQPPELPGFECNQVPEEDVFVRLTLRECNWLQAVEGELDTSHVGIMHFGAVNKEQFAGDSLHQYMVANRAPEYQIQETPYGYVYAAYRPATEDQLYWRFGHFSLPFWTSPPINDLSTNVLQRAFVPMDDTHTLFVSMFKKGAYTAQRSRAAEGISGASQNYPYLPNTTDWLGRWRLRANASNDYELNREVQRTRSFTGIEGVQLQDQAVQESMGEIVDRENETLAPSDIMIVRVRRLLLDAARAWKEEKKLHFSAEHPEIYSGVRGGQLVAHKDEQWLEAYKRQLAAAPWQGVKLEPVA
jgi:phthalate 4,5-dioxygenase